VWFVNVLATVLLTVVVCQPGAQPIAAVMLVICALIAIFYTFKLLGPK